MKTKTVTVHEGEYLGPVDWNYDFRQHDWDHGGAMNPQLIAPRVNMLRQLTDGRGWSAATGGLSYYGRVLEVGMYDGWPHWRPTPSVLVSTWLGAEWHSFYSISSIRRTDA